MAIRKHSKSTLVFLGILSFFFVADCATGIKTRSLLFRSNEFAIYTVDRKNIKLRNEKNVAERLSHPFEISEDKILDLLGNIKFREESSYGEVHQFVFQEAEIKTFAGDLVDGLKKLKPTQLLLIVSKYNPVKSVVSHYSRTSFYIWVTDQSVEVLFGELQQEIAYDEEGNYFDWSNIPDIPFDHSPQNTEIMAGVGFLHKKIDGFKHRRWLEFPLNDLKKLKFEKRKKSLPKELSQSIEEDLRVPKKIEQDQDGIFPSGE